MKKVEITCLTGSIRIPDLGLEMEKGDIETVDASSAARSTDLDRARRAKGVAVREVRKARRVRSGSGPGPGPRPTARQIKSRPGPPPAPRPTGPTHSTTRPGTSATPVVVQGIVGIEHSELREIIRTEVTGAVKDAIIYGKGPVSMSARHVPPEENKGLRGGLDPDPVIDDTPAFIPTKIVPDTGAEIKVDSDEREATSLDAAADKLKGSSKTRPKRKKKAKSKRKRKPKSKEI